MFSGSSRVWRTLTCKVSRFWTSNWSFSPVVRFIKFHANHWKSFCGLWCSAHMFHISTAQSGGLDGSFSTQGLAEEATSLSIGHVDGCWWGYLGPTAGLGNDSTALFEVLEPRLIILAALGLFMGVIIRTNVHIGLWRHAMNDARCTTYTKLGLSKFALSWNCKRSWLLVMSMFCLLQWIRRLLGWGPILWFQKSTFTESQPWGLVLLRGSHGLMGTQNWELQAGQTGQRLICLVTWYICEFPQWHSTLVDMLATVMGCRLLHVSFNCLLWTYFKETQSLSHTVAPVTLWQLCCMARVHG